MTGGKPTRTFSAPEDRELRARLYRTLARDLVSSPSPAAVVFESSTERCVPEVGVHPSELVATTLGSPVFRALRDQLVRSRGELDRGMRLASMLWALRPIDPPRSLATSTVASDLPEASVLLGEGGKLEFQTFWLSGRSDGRLWAGRRVRFSSEQKEDLVHRSPAVARFVATEWSHATGMVCQANEVRCPARAWARASSCSLPRSAWFAIAESIAERTAEPTMPERSTGEVEEGHTIVLGASGAGKTTFLAERAARAIRHGLAVLALDLHGDLAPAVVARLSQSERARVLAVDASQRPVAGVAALAGTSDRAASQFVAAVKRLSPDGSDVYWGFRLERIFDAFVRLVQESGGTLGDLYALLTDADRRDAARLATRSRELARFLDELGPIVRRSPEFLWAAAARLSKVILLPELTELLSPPDGGLPVEELLEQGRPLLVRIPFSCVGPEAASFAGSLILARVYLGLASRRGPTGWNEPIVIVLDEVQGLSPRLVAEMLTEGRKFGLRLAIASQYPERLAPELRLAAAGVNRNVVVFRVPLASAVGVGSWLGLPPADAQAILPDLPVGLGVARVPVAGRLGTVSAEQVPTPASDRAWAELVGRTLSEFPAVCAADGEAVDEATERLLLAILSCEERGAPARQERLVQIARGLPGAPIDPPLLDDRVLVLERGGFAQLIAGAWRLTPAGERRLGLRPVTGASRESDEHRALLLRAFRLFARHGHPLEIVRQGRYDTTLPDAVYHQIPERHRNGPPHELAEAIASAQRGWAWRFFGGRDVHVEAEVSGALRPARVRHGLEKARSRAAFALFVVGDSRRAARVRRTLRDEGLTPKHAQVWTLKGRDFTDARPVPP